MGIWFTSSALGNGLGGWVAGFYDTEGGGALENLFGGVTLYSLAGAVVLICLVRPVKRLMVGVR
jgi:POT family proton-dependent oligopeptide transporter